jgi:hypothetical protein
VKHLFRFLTQLFCRDIIELKAQNQEVLMRLSEIKAAVAESAKQSSEAFAELGSKIADLQKQVDDLIAGAQDPDVSDPDFLNDLNTLKTNVAELAAIVPNPTEPPAEPPTA